VDSTTCVVANCPLAKTCARKDITEATKAISHYCNGHVGTTKCVYFVAKSDGQFVTPRKW